MYSVVKAVRASSLLLTIAVVSVFLTGCSHPARTLSSSPPSSTRTSTSIPARQTPGLIFDGRASAMSYLRCDRTTCGQSPEQWSALQYCNDNITLRSDPRFGKVYEYSTNAQSNLSGCPSGPIWSPDVAFASLDHTPRYQLLGTVEYYRLSIRLPPGFAFVSPGWESFIQLGVGPYDGAVSLGLRQDFGPATHFEISLDGGQVVNCKGPAWWYDKRNILDLGDATRLEGHWVEFIIGVHWTTNAAGWVDVYMRVPDLGQNAFELKYHVTGEPTDQWGTCGSHRVSVRGTNGNGTVFYDMDQQSDYEGFTDPRPIKDFPSHTFLQSGYVIAHDLAAAEAVKP